MWCGCSWDHRAIRQWDCPLEHEHCTGPFITTDTCAYHLGSLRETTWTRHRVKGLFHTGVVLASPLKLSGSYWSKQITCAQFLFQVWTKTAVLGPPLKRRSRYSYQRTRIGLHSYHKWIAPKYGEHSCCWRWPAWTEPAALFMMWSDILFTRLCFEVFSKVPFCFIIFALYLVQVNWTRCNYEKMKILWVHFEWCDIS